MREHHAKTFGVTMSNPNHPASLGKVVAEATRIDARHDAISSRRNSYPGGDMNDDYDREIYQSGYNYELRS